MGVIIFAMFWDSVEITQYKLKKRNFLSIEFFVLWPTTFCKMFEKMCSKITMVGVRTWTPLANNTM